MNPFYMGKVIPKLFPNFTKGWENIKWKRTLVSVVVDTYILKWFNKAIYITGTNMVETRGDWEGTKELLFKSYKWQLLIDWLYYTPYKIILYGFVPLYLRNITAAAMSVTYAVLFSFM